MVPIQHGWSRLGALAQFSCEPQCLGRRNTSKFANTFLQLVFLERSLDVALEEARIGICSGRACCRIFPEPGCCSALAE